MAGLVPAIHVFRAFKTWMPGTSSAKARFALLTGHDELHLSSGWCCLYTLKIVSPRISSTRKITTKT
jgi:hypothetical protein